MQNRNIFALTEDGVNYPAYVSINHNDDRAGNGERTSMDIELTVRGAATEDGHVGPTAMIRLRRSQWKALVMAMLPELFKG